MQQHPKSGTGPLLPQHNGNHLREKEVCVTPKFISVGWNLTYLHKIMIWN